MNLEHFPLDRQLCPLEIESCKRRRSFSSFLFIFHRLVSLLFQSKFARLVSFSFDTWVIFHRLIYFMGTVGIEE